MKLVLCKHSQSTVRLLLLIVLLYFAPALHAANGIDARYLQIELPGKGRILSLAEVLVFSKGKSIAVGKKASQSSTMGVGRAELAIDGNINGDYFERTVTHTRKDDYAWWRVDLKKTYMIDKVVIYNRIDCCQERIKPATIILLNSDMTPVWKKRINSTSRVIKLGINKAVQSNNQVGHNLLKNTSFLQQTNKPLPDYWDLHHAAGRSLKNLHDNYGVTSEVDSPVHGTNVLKLVNDNAKFRHLYLIAYKNQRRLPDGKYTFSVYIKSDAVNGKVNFSTGWPRKEIISRPLARGWRRYSFTFVLKSHEVTGFQPIMRFSQQGRYYVAAPQLEYGNHPTKYTVSTEDLLENVGTDNRIVKRRNVHTDYIPDEANRSSVYFEYDYYTTEKTASVIINHGQNGAYNVHVACMDNQPISRPVTLFMGLLALPSKADVPISKLGKGKFACNIRLKSKAGNYGASNISAELTVLSNNETEIKINRNKRYVLFNSEKFNMVGILVSFDPQLPDWYLEDIKRHGINTVFFKVPKNTRGHYDPRSIMLLSSRLEKYGLKVIIGIPLMGNKKRKWIGQLDEFAHLVKQLQDVPNVIGWFAVDEPNKRTWSDEDVLYVYKKIKSIDPYRLVLINWGFDAIPTKENTEPVGGLQSSDVYSFDYYPFLGNKKSIDEFAQYFLLVAKEALKKKKLQHTWLQLYGGMNAWREPTPNELRYMAYLNFVFGSMVSYFDTKSNSKETWGELKRINYEGNVLAVTLWLDDNTVLKEIKKNNNGILYSHWVNGDKHYFITVNTMGRDNLLVLGSQNEINIDDNVKSAYLFGTGNIGSSGSIYEINYTAYESKVIVLTEID